MRFTRAAFIAAAMTILLAATTFAGGYCPPKYRDVTIDVKAREMLCGDPRAWSKVRSNSTIPVLVQKEFLPGNKSVNTRQAVQKTIQPRQAKVIGPRWVRGLVVLSVFNPDDQQWHEIYSYTVGKSLRSRGWDTFGCGSNRFETPSFRNPHLTGSYEAEYQVAVERRSR